MLKINELNKSFGQKRFFVNADAYNSLLLRAKGLARNVDENDSYIRDLKEKNRSLETRLETFKKKYSGALCRDPKTGRYLKRK